jgi:hypothetical protein
MREVRVPVVEVQPGELVVRIGRRELNERFRGLRDVPVGHRVVGPRGGPYALTAAGARDYVVMDLYVSKPVVRRDGFATVLREA